MPRKFGIEVEFGGNIRLVIDQIRAAGLSTRDSLHGYSGHSNTEWVVKTDASVHSGGELVSPPLDFDDPEQRGQVDRAFAALRAAGATTSRSAGVHVHIDASDLAPKQIGAVARTFTKYEDCIYRIASSGWNSMRPGAQTFCKPLPRVGAAINDRYGHPQPSIDKLAKAQTDAQLRKAWYGDSAGTFAGHGDASRYYGLNLHSWFYRGTVEFRVFNSTMNPKRAQAYIVLCMAIVQDARDGKQRSINRTFKLGDMQSGVLSEKKALHHLCQMLRWENKTTPVPKEDLDLITYVWKNSKPQAAFAAAVGY